MSKEELKKQVEYEIQNIDRQLTGMEKKRDFIQKSIVLLQNYKGTLQKQYQRYFNELPKTKVS